MKFSDIWNFPKTDKGQGKKNKQNVELLTSEDEPILAMTETFNIKSKIPLCVFQVPAIVQQIQLR